MAKPISPYRSLPADRRVELVQRYIASARESRGQFVRRLVERPGGFRPVTLQSWNAEKLAREVVRLGAESSQDEFDLMHYLYVEVEPQIQATFLEAAGVKHAEGVIDEELEAPYADAAGVERGAAAVRERHGEDGERYLRTLARYAAGAWPGIDDLVAAHETA